MIFNSEHSVELELLEELHLCLHIKSQWKPSSQSELSIHQDHGIKLFCARTNYPIIIIIRVKLFCRYSRFCNTFSFFLWLDLLMQIVVLLSRGDNFSLLDQVVEKLLTSFRARDVFSKFCSPWIQSCKIDQFTRCIRVTLLTQTLVFTVKSLWNTS